MAEPLCRRRVSQELRRHVTGDEAAGKRLMVLARQRRNRRLADALDQWAFCSPTKSAGARADYDELPARGRTHRQAVRQLANRWVGILHACLAASMPDDEQIAWNQTPSAA